MLAIARPEVLAAKRVVVKVGTRVLTHPDGGIALARLFQVVELVASLHRQGRDVMLVSSGAVGLGRQALRLGAAPTELAERQACAAVGQTQLMGLYREGFDRLGIVCGQVLLTEADFSERLRYLNLRSALSAMLRHRVVPIANENDVVATDELALQGSQGRAVFGDNDMLSALVAGKLGADLLLLLTDVAGVYSADPSEHTDAQLLERVDAGDVDLEALTGSRSGVGRGGMRSKVAAALVAARSGCHVVIASGVDRDAMHQAARGEPVGTFFPAMGRLSARQRWMAFATRASGALHLDEGAVQALTNRGASLLAAGVTRVEGQFERGDVVELRNPQGEIVGRGIAEVGAAEALAWSHGEVPTAVRNHDALVHRDHLVLEE